MRDDLQHALRDAEQALDKGKRATRESAVLLREADRWLRVSTVCRRLDVHFRTVHRWIDQGRFGQHGAMQLPNKHWRIKESALAHLVERHDY